MKAAAVPFGFAIAWGATVFALILNGGFAIAISPGRNVSPDAAMVLGLVLSKILFWGWTIPLAVGIKRLISKG